MRILRLPAYFYPELMASTHLQNDRVEGFTKAGHTIVVYTPTPTRGIDEITRKKYKKMKYEELYDGKVEIHRFSLMKEGRNPVLRAVRYALCVVIQYIKASKAKDIDVIYASSTPPIQGLICKRLQKKLSKKQGKPVPIIYNLQDIFPDSLVTTGLTKENSLLFKIGRKIENRTYDAAQSIIVISESFKRNIMYKGVPEGKIQVIPNWIDADKVQPVPKDENRLFEEFGISREKFLVVYAGNFGMAQGADVVIDAAIKLRDRKDIHFVVFGGGTEFDNAKKKAELEALENITINSLLPEDRVSEAYSLGDVALITCKAGVGSSGMPSKTWSIMACNTPIIASFDTDSELAEILDKSGAGICVEAGNAETLAEAICKCADDGNMPSGGRQYVIDNASKEICVRKYIEICESCDLNSKINTESEI